MLVTPHPACRKVKVFLFKIIDLMNFVWRTENQWGAVKKLDGSLSDDFAEFFIALVTA